jgi:hypothetical protein
MDPKKVLVTLQKLGLPITPRAAMIALVVVPLALAALAFLWKKRASLSKLPGWPKRAPAGESAAMPGVHGNQLRSTWQRFMKTLPRTFRRSILSFDHFVVLGDASCGKSVVVDRYTDFRRQAKQFHGSHVFDSHIDLYVGSRSVIMELAASVLLDVGPKCRRALQWLWRPLYRRTAPTVVVVADMERLQRADYDLVDYAERVRGKINLLSEICKRPLEVRVALTHLDQSPGFEAYAELCSAEKIPLYIPIKRDPAQPMAAQIEAWVERARDQLSRALVRRGADQLRACIHFLRDTQSYPKPLGKFLEVLLAPEAFSSLPIAGGVYLTSPQAAGPNPLQGRPVGLKPPDPRRRHRVIALATAGVVIMYLSTAFLTQRHTRLLASTALASYVPVTREQEQERLLRETIQRFACAGCGPIARLPDFYAGARVELREQFSDRVRSELLIPNLRKVARDGALLPGSLPIRMRRSLFYLALIHGDRDDNLRIRKDRKRLQAWAEMTELPPALIEMYLESTEHASSEVVQFELPEQHDPRDMAPYWISLLSDIEKRMSDDQSISAEELKALQLRAADAAQALKRFDHDDLVEEILSVVLGSESHDALANHTRYKLQFEVFGTARKQLDLSRDDGNNTALAELLQTIRASYVEAPDVPLVATLADRLSSLYDLPAGGNATQARTLHIADKTFKFDPTRWAALVRNAQANALVSALMRRDAAAGSVFLSPAASASYGPARWNATNDGSAIFIGRAEIAPLYTRAAYDDLVSAPVQKLQRALERASLPKAQKDELKEFVKRQVRSYAIEYKRQLRVFYDSFALATPSIESLRVAVSQMAVDDSPYSAFLHVVHRQVDIDTSSELLVGMQQELREYAGLRQLFDHAEAEGEIGKYRAILAQLLQDLGKPGDTAGPDDPGAPADPSRETLEHALSQAGLVALLSVRGDKGSYAQMIRDWHASLGLQPVLLGPFLGPIFELERIGLRDTQRVLSRAWNEQIAPDVQRISHKFPFDTHEYAEDVTPQELDSLFNPSTGRLFSFVRRYLTLLADPHAQAHYRMREIFKDRLELPERMLSTINAGESLSTQLYDAKGRAAPLTLQIATVPFEHGNDPRFGLTLMYLSVGDASIQNFNQRPGLTTLHIDWTREQTSQVGIQLMNLDTQEKVFPEPLVTPSSSWSALHLLAMAKVSSVKKPANGQLYVWQVRHQPEGGRSTAVRFIVIGNPFAPFTLGASGPALAWTGGVR